MPSHSYPASSLVDEGPHLWLGQEGWALCVEWDITI